MRDLLPNHLELPGYPCAWSPCRRYRYVLWRLLDGPGERPCMFIGLNPSTADEERDDPTIRRCKGFARAWGCDSLIMTNLFAWRATKPKDMKAAEDPIGPENDLWLLRLAKLANVTVAAWGAHGSYQHRDWQIERLGIEMRCLDTTKNGSPKHPLYIRADTPLRPWPA